MSSISAKVQSTDGGFPDFISSLLIFAEIKLKKDPKSQSSWIIANTENSILNIAGSAVFISRRLMLHLHSGAQYLRLMGHKRHVGEQQIKKDSRELFLALFLLYLFQVW